MDRASFLRLWDLKSRLTALFDPVVDYYCAGYPGVVSLHEFNLAKKMLDEPTKNKSN